jgi:hypothetical protein
VLAFLWEQVMIKHFLGVTWVMVEQAAENVWYCQAANMGLASRNFFSLFQILIWITVAVPQDIVRLQKGSFN